MSTRRNRFVSHSRARAIHEVDVRRAWMIALSKTRELGRRVGEGQEIDKFERSGWAGLVIRLVPLDLGYPTAEAVMQAFIGVGRAAAAAGLPANLVPVLDELAACLDEMLAAEAHRLAEVSRRIMGERD